MAANIKKYVLVVNLKSRQSEMLVDEVKKVFSVKKAELEIIKVKDPSKITTAFQKAIDKDPDVIILGGGDGTLISGIEYLSSKNYSKPIGLLPLGTANYLARNLDIPLTVEESIQTVLNGKSRAIPIGVANEKFFALTFIVGLTQKVAAEVSDKLKRKLGQIAYILELIKQTKNHDAFRYTIESPALRRPLKGTTHQIIVYNSDINLQLKLVPDHSIERKSFKVVISRCGRSKAKLYFGFLMHIISFGKLRPYMYVFETSSLNIKTEPALTADYDGEPYGKGPFEIKLYEKNVHIIC